MYNLGNSDRNLLASNQEENKYYDENIEIDINDKNNTHSIIAKYIKPGSKCLDVGCGSGYLGKLLIGKNCEVYGIDSDAKALEISYKKCGYKNVMFFNIADETLDNYKKFFDNDMEFDYIIFADVLEHLVDPGSILAKFATKLSINGEILTSVPNIAHLDIIRGLINRTFNYNKIGILDNTHLRFFTKNSFADFIAGINELYNLNFKIKKIGKTINEPWYADKYLNINRLLNDDNELMVLQYVYALKKHTSKVKYEENIYQDYYKELDNIVANNIQYKKDIDILKHKIDDKKKELSLSIEKNNNKILKLKKDLSEANEDLSEANKEIDNLRRKLEQELIINKNILNSKSWKITKPLRYITSIINKK
jgi:2-polyprenyl-3-methyl-5-hydroxy-6-metoxy-1,4-benzoquinol methylase